MSLSNILTYNIFNEFDLGILISDNYKYHITNSRTTIGYYKKSITPQIDLSFFDHFNCNHISRLSAVISLLSNFNFYIENVGISIFRVNGKIINSNCICKLNSYCLIDFSDILFLFIPNEKFLKKISKILNK